MTNQEAIKYLQQLYPNGGHCWLDEQRIEAIGMAVKTLQEEPVSEDLKEASRNYADKEKFRKEVEKLKSNLIHGACSSQIAMETRCKEEAYNEVLAILDTMQEEPVSVWHDASEELEEEPTIPDIVDEHYWEMLGEEPISEDLDIAIGEYCSNPDNFITYIDVAFAYRSEQKDDIPLIIKAIKFGAKWQKEKDKSKTEDLGEYINKLSKQFPEVSFAKLSRIAVRVAKWQKEQFEKKED